MTNRFRKKKSLVRTEFIGEYFSSVAQPLLMSWKSYDSIHRPRYRPRQSIQLMSRMAVVCIRCERIERGFYYGAFR